MAITPLPTNIADGVTKANAAFFNGIMTTINNNFVEVGSGGGGGSGPFLSVQSDAFGAIGDGVADDTVAIQAAFTAAATTSGTVWFPAGTYLISDTLEVPTGVSVLGPGAQLCIISTSSAITMMTVGSYPSAAGDRYGTLAGFALDGNDAATIGLDLIKVCVQRNFRDLEVRDINGIGYRLDASQNCMFEATHVRGCDTGWAILNDAGTNTWVNFEIDDSNNVGMIFDDDAALGGYALAAFGHQGPGQNTFIGGLYERGTMVKGLDVVKGRGNKWIGCYFTNFGSTALQYHTHLQTDALDNRFIDCQWNGNSAAVSGYEGWDYAVYNEGFRNHLIRPTFEFQSMTTASVAATTNTLFVQHPQLSNNYQFTWAGGGDSRKGIVITPLPSQAVGTTVNRPNFGAHTSPWWYYDYTLSRPVYWDGEMWTDPIGTSGGAYTPGGTDVALVDGGTGSSLIDPNADRIMFWDDSIGAVTWLTPGANLSITGSTLDATSGGITDGDKGDIVVAGSGTTWTIDTNAITKTKMADDSVGVDELDASGTPSGTTFLRGDMTWATPAGGGSGMSNLVDDATPQLGGDLDLNGHTVGDATATDLTRLHGVTSAVQTQLDAKVPGSRTVNAKPLSANVTLTQDDVGDGTTNKAYSATDKTKLAGIASAADVTATGNVGTAIHGSTAKTSLVDADEIAMIDSAASNVLKRITWANLKAAFKSYYDSVASTLSSKSISFGSNTVTTTKAQLNTAVTDGEVVFGSTNGTAASKTLWTGTQAQFDAIVSKDSATVYVVTP